MRDNESFNPISKVILRFRLVVETGLFYFVVVEHRAECGHSPGKSLDPIAFRLSGLNNLFRFFL